MVGGVLILDKNYVFENITHKLSPSADYGTGGFGIRYVADFCFNVLFFVQEHGGQDTRNGRKHFSK